MIKKSFSTILLSLLIIISPIIFTECTAYKTVNKVANSINNISDMITEYDAQAKHYISVVNKAKKGDILALKEASEVFLKAKNYKKELDKLIPSMTSSQKKDVIKIEKSILNAAKSIIK